ncbi:hypothetical protein ACWU4D_13850 [Vibrio sp. WJH972]
MTINSATLKSALRQSPLIVISLALLYLSMHFGISSLFQIGLENEVDRYAEFMLSADTQSPDFEDKAQEQRDTVNRLADDILDMNSANPDVLALLGYIATTNYWDGEDAETALTRASEVYRSASHIRPLYSATYAEEAYVLTYQNQPFELVQQRLELAQHFGPYQNLTASTGIDLLFANWQELDTDQRLLAIRYFSEHSKYGFNRYELNDLVAVSLEKEKLCSVATFVGLDLRSCRKK